MDRSRERSSKVGERAFVVMKKLSPGIAPLLLGLMLVRGFRSLGLHGRNPQAAIARPSDRCIQRRKRCRNRHAGIKIGRTVATPLDGPAAGA
jgi:hypothetical protein